LCRTLHTQKTLASVFKSSGNEAAKKAYFSAPDAYGASFLISKQSTFEVSLEIYNALEQEKRNLVVNRSILGMCKKFGHYSEGLKLWENMFTAHADPACMGYVIGFCASSNQRTRAPTLFEQIRQHAVQLNTYHYNLLIKSLNVATSLRVLDYMKSVNCTPDNFTYSILLTKCISNHAFNEASVIVQEILESGVKYDIIVANTMLTVLTKKRDMNAAMELFYNILKTLEPNERTFSILLSGCTTVNDRGYGDAIQKYITDHDITLNTIMSNALLSMYINTEQVQEAEKVFYAIEKPDSRTYTTMLSGYANSGMTEKGLELYKKTPNEYKDTILRTTLLKLYTGSNQLQNAVKVFDELLQGKPDDHVFVTMLAACAERQELEIGKYVHSKVKSKKILSNSVNSALVSMYAKCHSLADAMTVFKLTDTITSFAVADLLEECANVEDVTNGTFILESIDIETQHVIVQCAATKYYSKIKQTDKATSTLQAVLKQTLNCLPSEENTLVAILTACAHVSMPVFANQVYDHLGREYSLKVMNVILYMLAKCGLIEKMEQVFLSIQTNKNIDLVTWNVVMSGYGMNGQAQKSLMLFQNMVDQNVMPDATTFTALLSGCAHSLLLEKAKEIFKLMPQYGVQPNVIHYNCMVDVLGRCNRLSEAEEMIKSIKPTYEIWISFLGGCRLQNDIPRAEKAYAAIQKPRPKDSVSNVMLANIYSSNGLHDKASIIWNAMKKKGIKKIPGITQVQIGDKIISTFARTIPEEYRDTIVSEREKLYKEIATVYSPNTSVVTDDVDEITKNMILCEHSEKTAIILALATTYKPIHMIKNLRICIDCHEFTKAVSKVRNRVIKMRDAQRYHEFENGRCSCNDVW
jgi:pentatricopeptide repeat protein